MLLAFMAAPGASEVCRWEETPAILLRAFEPQGAGREGPRAAGSAAIGLRKAKDQRQGVSAPKPHDVRPRYTSPSVQTALFGLLAQKLACYAVLGSTGGLSRKLLSVGVAMSRAMVGGAHAIGGSTHPGSARRISRRLQISPSDSFASPNLGDTFLCFARYSSRWGTRDYRNGSVGKRRSGSDTFIGRCD
jgi:hypothetical protein